MFPFSNNSTAFSKRRLLIYSMKCENEDCHNYYGMELRENEFSIADFVEWNEKILIKNSEPDMTIADNVIPFEKRNFRLV